MVSVWFKPEVNLATMIDLFKQVKEELEKTDYKINGQIAKTKPEISPQK